MGAPPERDDAVELPLEHQKYVLEAFSKLDSLTHYDVLGVPRDADKKTIKRAYFHLASIVHPDRHFGKNLGSFKPKMEALFARITEAYDALGSPDKRARYDATLGRAPSRSVPVPKAPEVTAAHAAPSARPDDEGTKRQAALDALKRRVMDAKGVVRQHVDAAERARAAGDFVGAAEAYRAAMALAPNDAALAAAHADATRAATAKLGESYRRQALLEERYGHWAEAARSWARVCEAHPGDPDAKQRHAAALAKSRG